MIIPNQLVCFWIVFQIYCHIFGLYSKYIAIFWDLYYIGHKEMEVIFVKNYILKFILFMTFAGQPAATE